MTKHGRAPNQYVALGFQGMINMGPANGKDSVKPILSYKGNKLTWAKQKIVFQNGWPLLHEVSMD